ncbi:FAD linked oxidase domain protein [Kribbella flavida DSM 17836]|uniref:FAD linked oxidase domain protein n=1 Tax=Kribbella flavida (strain DSM 17836 / JCM 10339 / NBRC 14399) TaxID=479435 RepID=D2PQY5_KRIFD|nr:FAD-dependent oxidoreductase [Kribbella flavida]ADB31118.1 FAD linked oxidase domain protein [Kribbella flavida DSM 17836]
MKHRVSTVDLPGEVLMPGDVGYTEASTTFFGRGAPALVVRPADVDQVVRAVRRAAAHGLTLSVRSGGHSLLAHGTNTGGMVLDLSRLDRVEVVDPDTRRVRVGGGATWGQVAAALTPYGWGLTAGDTAGVGVGGLTLGGGIGWMVRKHGLAIDNLVAARVVTADGRVLVVDEHEHPELFWALRGGGGNFGVVVDFDFIAQPVGTVHFGTITYAVEQPARQVSRWRDHLRQAPEELSSTLSLVPPLFGMPPAVTVTVCFAGEDADAAAAAIEPLVALGTVTDWQVRERPYAGILEEVHEPPGLRVAGRNVLLPLLDDSAVAAFVAAHAQGMPGIVSLRSLGGAFSRVPAAATAFAHRDAEAMAVCLAFVEKEATEADVEQVLRPWTAIASRGSGVYLNFQGSATAADLAAAYPPATYARLVAVKRRYDPANLFRLNHNIAPDTAAAGGAA